MKELKGFESICKTVKDALCKDGRLLMADGSEYKIPIKAIEKMQSITTYADSVLPKIGNFYKGDKMAIQELLMCFDCSISSFNEEDECINTPDIRYLKAVYTSEYVKAIGYAEECGIRAMCKKEIDGAMKIITGGTVIKKLPMLRVTGADTGLPYVITGFFCFKGESNEWAYGLFIYDITDAYGLKPIILPITNNLITTAKKN